MTVKCSSAHGLIAEAAVSITGAVVPITILSITRVGPLATVITINDHDLTEPIAPTIEISGADQNEFNGVFPRVRVLNRRTVTFTVEDSGPLSGTGTMLLLGAESAFNGYNGTVQVVSTPNPNEFTFTQTNTVLPDPVSNGMVAKTRPRIGSAVSPERAQEVYTEQNNEDLSIFVTLEDVNGLKNRNILTENIDNLSRGNEYRQQITQPFSLYLFVPSTNSTTGAVSRDIAEELFASICKSLLFSEFDSNLFVGKQGSVQFVNHGSFAYNTALYIHQYSFVQTVDLVFEDTVGPDLDVAMRDINFTLFPVTTITEPTTTSGTVSGDVDLDDIPL